MSTISSFLSIIIQLSNENENDNIFVRNIDFILNKCKSSSASEKITLNIRYNVIVDQHKSTVE